MTQSSAHLRQHSEQAAARLPPLLVRAERLAGTMLLGEHGRRRAGLGDDFWQYRPAQVGDPLRLVDWRRSARSDSQYVRQREWQIAQSVILWVDQAASMRFASDKGGEQKADRARLLALAAAILLVRGGERVGLGEQLPPRTGQAQLTRLADLLVRDQQADYGLPQVKGMLAQARAVFMSDFLGDFDALRDVVAQCADRGVRGVLVQILDPVEEAFPYRGRTIFESIGGGISHETLKAGDLRARYLERLTERKAALADLATTAGWRYHCHHTGTSGQSALLWLYRALEGGAR